MANLPLSSTYPGVMLILDEFLRISQVTPEFCKKFECGSNEIVGEILENLFSSKDKKGLFIFHGKLSRYEKGFLDSIIVIVIRGKEFITRLRLLKQEKQWFATFEDILAEEDDIFREVYLARQRWASIVRNSSEGIAIIDTEGRLVEFNSRFLEIIQFRSPHGILLNEDAILNRPILEILKDQELAEMRKFLSNLKPSKRINKDIRYNQHYLNLELNPIYLPVKTFAGCSLVIKDITNQKQLELLTQQLQQKNQELEAAHQKITVLNANLKQENLRLSAELEVTRQLQQMILPKPEELEIVEGLEIAGFMEPTAEVGGDYYDVIQQDGKVKISIGDVTGHGLESGVVMLMTQTAVRTLQESNQTDPVRFLDILNRTIYHNIQRINPYKNLTLALLDYRDRTLQISGQHEEVIVVRTSGQVERIDTRFLGFPLGLEEEIADFVAQQQVQLNSGDIVVLYTDGITEAYDLYRHQYGIERLCEVASRNCQRSAAAIRQAVIDDVRQHIGEQKVCDDITLLVLKQK